MTEPVLKRKLSVSRAAPTFARAGSAIAGIAVRIARRHPRLLKALGVITVGCAALWLADYCSRERVALRRVAELRGRTAGPNAFDQMFRRWRSNPLTRSLSRLPSKKIITGLILEGKRPSDNDVARFVAAFPRLETLDVSSTPITDAACESIAAVPMLSMLEARHTAVTDQGIARLAASPHLSIVHLDGTQITDAGMADLAKLPRLSWLQVSRTQITDAGLAHLYGTKLRWLDVSDTRVTAEGVEAFRRAHPGCNVVW